MGGGFLSRYKVPLLVLFLLVLPFVFYISNSKETRDHNIVDRFVVWVSAPVQWVVVGTIDGVASLWRQYIALVDVQADNQVLRTENAELRAELARREEERFENIRLRSLFALTERSPDIGSLFARIIATSPSPLFRSVRVNRGTRDGVRVGSAVVNHDGVVGRVAAVGAHWADVMLLVDANSSTDVLVQRTRARARIRGLGGDAELGIRVEFLARTDEIEPGDLLVTSGIGTVFPKGLPVGRVVSVENRAFGLYKGAQVEPSVNFERLEEVIIIRSGWDATTSFEMGPAQHPPQEPSPQISLRAKTPKEVAVPAVDSGAAGRPRLEPQPKPKPKPKPKRDAVPAAAFSIQAPGAIE